jgi:hypothetical protein
VHIASGRGFKNNELHFAKTDVAGWRVASGDSLGIG